MDGNPGKASEPLSYTLKGAIAATSVSRSSLLKEIKMGRLRSLKMGKRVLILSDDLRAWLLALPVRTPGRRY